MKLSYIDCINVIKEMRGKDDYMPVELESDNIYLSRSSGKYCLSFNDKRFSDGRNKKFGMTESQVKKLIMTKMKYT